VYESGRCDISGLGQHAELGNDEKGNQQQLEAIAPEVGEYAAIVGQALGERKKYRKRYTTTAFISSRRLAPG
jgi:hypothetical protein